MTEQTLQLKGFKCRILYSRSSGTPVIFFHGFSYSSEVWERIGVLDLLKEKKIPFLAFDMPYGTKSECGPKTQSPEKNVDFAKTGVERIFRNEKPLLVGASMGGHIALKFASMHPVRGLLLISPGRALSKDLVGSYERLDFPVRIIWGTADNIISGEDMRTLSAKLPNAKLITYEGASHSAYISEPEKFKQDLLSLYALVEQ